MSAAMKVTYNGVEHTLKAATTSDMVAWEREYQLPAVVLSNAAEARVEWLAFLVFRGLRRAGIVPKDAIFDDELIDGLESIEFIADGSAPPVVDPFDPAVSMPS